MQIFHVWFPRLAIKWQKPSFIGVLIKTCSENTQEIYRRKLMPECDFNKVEKRHFGIDVLLQICYKYLEHLFLTILLEGCFWSSWVCSNTDVTRNFTQRIFKSSMTLDTGPSNIYIWLSSKKCFPLPYVLLKKLV